MIGGSAQTTALIVGGLSVALFAAARLIRPLRAGVDAIDSRVLVGFHFLRAAGVAFLILGRKGLIFGGAIQFGFGELAVALTAIGVIWLLSVPLGRSPRSLVAWSLFGIVNLGFLLWHLEPGFGVRPGTDAPSTLPLTIYLWTIVPLAAATQLELLRRGLSRK